MTVRCCPIALYEVYRSPFFSPTPFSLISSGPLLPASMSSIETWARVLPMPCVTSLVAVGSHTQSVTLQHNTIYKYLSVLGLHAAISPPLFICLVTSTPPRHLLSLHSIFRLQ